MLLTSSGYTLEDLGLIGDDGEVDERQLYVEDEIVEGNLIRYFWFGFDIGAGAGRNRLVNLCDTKIRHQNGQ